MANAMYLEQYLDSLESLPAELQRNFKLLRTLDQQVQENEREAERMMRDYMEQARQLKKTERLAQISSIQRLFGRGKTICSDKVSLAAQTYEMVDKHIRRLDGDLARFEAELKAQAAAGLKGAGAGNAKLEDGRTGKGAGGAGGRKRGRDDGANAAGGSSSNRKKKNMRDGAAGNTAPLTGGIPASAALALTLTNNPAEVLDMPVDPNEPTYCLCHQVSYGEMVGCDNPDCPIEWFHFGCVGLTTQPKGKWFCLRCTEERKRK